MFAVWLINLFLIAVFHVRNYKISLIYVKHKEVSPFFILNLKYLRKLPFIKLLKIANY